MHGATVSLNFAEGVGLVRKDRYPKNLIHQKNSRVISLTTDALWKCRDCRSCGKPMDSAITGNNSRAIAYADHRFTTGTWKSLSRMRL